MDSDSIPDRDEGERHKKSRNILKHFDSFSAVRTRLELATSCVTGRHSNQLNYRTIILRTCKYKSIINKCTFGFLWISCACLPAGRLIPLLPKSKSNYKTTSWFSILSSIKIKASFIFMSSNLDPMI